MQKHEQTKAGNLERGSQTEMEKAVLRRDGSFLEKSLAPLGGALCLET